MTRKEEIARASKDHHLKHYPNFTFGEYVSFIDGAKWADRTMIKKACEWLRNNWRNYVDVDSDGVVCFGHWENDFCKAMKGGEE